MPYLLGSSLGDAGWLAQLVACGMATVMKSKGLASKHQEHGTSMQSANGPDSKPWACMNLQNA
jgi:hypothetical protein